MGVGVGWGMRWGWPRESSWQLGDHKHSSEHVGKLVVGRWRADLVWVWEHGGREWDNGETMGAPQAQRHCCFARHMAYASVCTLSDVGFGVAGAVGYRHTPGCIWNHCHYHCHPL